MGAIPGKHPVAHARLIEPAIIGVHLCQSERIPWSLLANPKLTLTVAGGSGSRRWHAFRQSYHGLTKGCPGPGQDCAMTFMPHSLLVAAHPSRRWTTFARHTVSVAG